MKKILIIFIFCSSVYANTDVGTNSGKKIPRFVSLKSSEANLRIGPSLDYPIILQYVVKNIPLKVIDEFNDWRKIEDWNNNSGWMHLSLLSSSRFGIIKRDINNIYKKPNGNIIGIIGKDNIIKLKKCERNWCLFSIKKLKGWLKKDSVWGVFNNENFD